ncbi:hypothetical protein Tco_1533688 [Tanacetum coccineum]
MDQPVWNNVQRVNHQKKLTHPHPKRNFVTTAVATKLGQAPLNAAKQKSPRSAASISTARPVNTAAPKSKVNDALPKTYSYFKAHSPDQGILDSGCSRHMAGNKSFLTDYPEVDGGFVAFAGCPKGGKITRKGKIRTGKLDFEDVYFIKELNFNLFSVSQMCDKKNSVLFTKTECLVLSHDFKLLDESQVLLKVSRQNNMYSFDLKNVVPLGEKLDALMAANGLLVYSRLEKVLGLQVVLLIHLRIAKVACLLASGGVLKWVGGIPGFANVVAEKDLIRNPLCEFHALLFTAMLVYCGNVSVVYMSTNSAQH